MQENASLTPTQEHLITLLVAGSSVVDAARACKINESTAHRWRKLPAFQTALAEAKRQAFNDALGELQSGVKDAIKTLQGLMKEAENESVRLRAAQIWLDMALQIHTKHELEARFDELEALMKQTRR